MRWLKYESTSPNMTQIQNFQRKKDEETSKQFTTLHQYSYNFCLTFLLYRILINIAKMISLQLLSIIFKTYLIIADTEMVVVQQKLTLEQITCSLNFQLSKQLSLSTIMKERTSTSTIVPHTKNVNSLLYFSHQKYCEFLKHQPQSYYNKSWSSCDVSRVLPASDRQSNEWNGGQFKNLHQGSFLSHKHTSRDI